MNADALKLLLQRLTWAIPLLVIAVFATSVASLYLLQTRPAAARYAEHLQQQTTEQVFVRINTLVDQSERALLTFRDWGLNGILTADDHVSLNRILTPFLQQRSTVSSAHIATESGREILLLKAGNRIWKNRITDVANKGTQQRWLEWSDNRQPVKEEIKEQDYDPRKRPWFKGAMSSQPGQIFWSAPYIFQTTGEPGITLSIRWTHEKTGQSMVVALDLLLFDLTQFTNQLTHAEHGYAALLTDDGKVLGLPRHELFNTPEAIKRSVLQEPAKIGLHLLDAGFNQWRQNNSGTDAITLKQDGEAWTITQRTMQVRNQTFVAATLAPLSDFSPLSARLGYVLGGLFIAALSLALILARRLSKGVTLPVSQLFDELEASNQRLIKEAATKSAASELAPRMQEANTLQDLGNTVLSDFAKRIGITRGSLYRVDTDNEQLVLCSAFAHEKAIEAAEKINFGEGLLGECARTQQTVALDNLPADYFPISTTLGSAVPASILMVPVMSNNKLQGVIEMASFNKLGEPEQALLKEILPMLAMCIEVIERNRPQTQSPC